MAALMALMVWLLSFFRERSVTRKQKTLQVFADVEGFVLSDASGVRR
jgi:hypothetical protein